MRKSLEILPVLVMAALALVGSARTASDDIGGDGFQRFVRDDGSIHFDPAALSDLAHLGSWFVPEGDAAGFHHVYTQPGTIEAYREVGEFPDGTVLVKELRGHERGDYTTGQDVASATDTTQWFLMVKDSQGRFPEHPLWGHGWGWALFKPDAPGRNVASSYRADCLGCHAPAAATEWVYVNAYPGLQP